MLALADRRLVILGAGAALVGVVVLSVVLRNARSVGRAVGEGAGELATGAVVGVGSALGLPDPAEPAVREAGRQALDEGDYLQASMRLPALEFLNGIGSKFGLWVYEVTHDEEGG